MQSQYRTSEPLESRVDLHERFSTNRLGWHPWVIGRIARHLTGEVLEVGCGTAALWSKTDQALPELKRLVLADYSTAMATAARDNTLGIPGDRACVVADAQRLPFPDGAFDAVLCFHMLYDVVDIDAALAEIARVVRPEGVVLFSTNGREHLKELDELVARHMPGAGWPDGLAQFTLENAQEVLSGFFREVELEVYPDGLVVTEVLPLLRWARGVPGAPHDLSEFEKAVRRMMSTRGARDSLRVPGYRDRPLRSAFARGSHAPGRGCGPDLDSRAGCSRPRCSPPAWASPGGGQLRRDACEALRERVEEESRRVGSRESPRRCSSRSRSSERTMAPQASLRA